MSKPKEKISDQVARGDFVFLEPRSREDARTFADMFPTIVELQITVEENGDPAERFYPRYLSLQDTTQAFDCSEPRCKGGGFLFFANGLRNAVAERTNEFHEAHRCRGVTRQRPRVVQCTHRFTVKGTIQYKDANEMPPELGG